MRAIIAGLLFAAMAVPECGAEVRLKDISWLRGSRDYQLIGYGLVVGLSGTGDTLRNAPFTEQALQSMLDRMGLNVRGQALRNRNAAAVIVTADVQGGADVGTKIDVTVSALGDATSLMGGSLLLTTLSGPDTASYANAQGAVSVTGFDVAGQSEAVTQGVPTVGRISNGGTMERAPPQPPDDGNLALELKNPDFRTAIAIVDAINAFATKRFGRKAAYERDGRTVVLKRPPQISTPRFMAEIGGLSIEPDTAARVVIDARTGTIVIGQDVQISTVAITHGTLTVRVSETPVVSQPAPRSGGRTVTTSQTQIEVGQTGGPITLLGGTTLSSLVNGLNKVGLKPAGIIAILQAVKTAGALQADLVVQ